MFKIICPSPLRAAMTPALMFALFPALLTNVGAQDRAAKQANALTVDGRVEQVFRSDDQSLVQLLVSGSVASEVDLSAGIRYPAPGEYVYIHVRKTGSVLGRVVRGERAPTVPNRQRRIQAFLNLGPAGQWEAAGNDWFRDIPAGPEGSIVAGAGSSRGRSSLGIVSETVRDGRETLLKVTRVTPGSPAAKAGIEPGDLLVEANRQPLQSQRQLDDSYTKSGGSLALTVRDVRTGRDVLVDVESTPMADPQQRMPLGLTTALAFYDGEPVVKVTAVDAGSPAQRAGITTGLLIIEANGTSIKSPETLTNAERNSRGQLQLRVVDPNSKRERKVQVSL